MIFKTEFFNLRKYLQSGTQPSVVIKRPKLNARERQALFLHAQVNATGKFWVPNGPIQPGEELRWSFCDEGDHVVTLFHAYLTPSKSPATIWPVGVQVGLLALKSFQEQTQEEPEVLYTFCGQDVFDKGDNLQCLLALAIRVKE